MVGESVNVLFGRKSFFYPGARHSEALLPATVVYHSHSHSHSQPQPATNDQSVYFMVHAV